MQTVAKYCRIYIVRHGETDHNVNGIIQGQTNTTLNSTGEKQSLQGREKFKHIYFDAAFSSDLLRAKRTAEILVAERKLIVNTHHLLRERNFGKWEDKTYVEYQEANKELLSKLSIMSEGEKREVKYDDNYESENELASRALLFLRELAVTYLDKNILVVSHGGLMRAVLTHLGFASLEELKGRSIENVAHVLLESDGVDFFIKETKGINKIGSTHIEYFPRLVLLLNQD